MEPRAPLVVCLDRGYRHTMATKRKSHNLNETLLRRAQRTLGTATETDTIHEALRAVLIGEQLLTDLKSARGPGTFHRHVVSAMRRERRASR